MHIVSVNVGRRRRLDDRSFAGDTGIFKTTRAAPVRVGPLGLEGDDVVNTRHHGGPDQAVYAYREEDYRWWSEQLGQALGPGTFGDNLTLAGLPEAAVPIGARLRFSEVLLEVTAPRIPCNTLAARMGDPAFVKRFVRAERPGLYCRVIDPGSVRAGEPFGLSGPGPAVGPTVTTLDLFRASYRRLTADELERFLAAPIDVRTRGDFTARLSEARSHIDSEDIP